jgi:hypothetical protein
MKGAALWVYMFFADRRAFRVGLAEVLITWTLRLLPAGSDEFREFAQFVQRSWMARMLLKYQTLKDLGASEGEALRRACRTEPPK